MRETPARERADVRVNMDGVSVISEIEVQVAGSHHGMMFTTLTIQFFPVSIVVHICGAITTRTHGFSRLRHHRRSSNSSS